MSEQEDGQTPSANEHVHSNTDYATKGVSVTNLFPLEFTRFLEDHGVCQDALVSPDDCSSLRYIRVNPRAGLDEETVSEHFVSGLLGGVTSHRVQWLSGQPPSDAVACGGSSWCPAVFAFDAKVNLSRTMAYRTGQLYGMDAASVFAVRCLGARAGEKVLDLCCAPGAKLCAIADAVGPSGDVVGVDVAENRLAACRSVVNKYSVTNVRLSLGDGTTWEPRTATWLTMEPPPKTRGERAKRRRREAADRKRRFAEIGNVSEAQVPNKHMSFERVLVDAECTHDASLRHVEKFANQWGWETLETRIPWLQQSERLHKLQLSLLQNGFRLLQEGGTLVYSTCSFCSRQNEDIVREFLRTEPSASLEQLPFRLEAQAVGAPEDPPLSPLEEPLINNTVSCTGAPAKPSALEADGPLGKNGNYCTARFEPRFSGTSGLFVARLRKKAPA